MGYVLRRMKNPKKLFANFSFWDIVDLKCEKSEKCDQNFFFRPISMKFFMGTIQTKVFTLKKIEIFCWYAVEREPVPMRVLKKYFPWDEKKYFGYVFPQFSKKF